MGKPHDKYQFHTPLASSSVLDDIRDFYGDYGPSIRERFFIYRP